jgi:hypothetical protein
MPKSGPCTCGIYTMQDVQTNKHALEGRTLYHALHIDTRLYHMTVPAVARHAAAIHCVHFARKPSAIPPVGTWAQQQLSRHVQTEERQKRQLLELWLHMLTHSTGYCIHHNDRHVKTRQKEREDCLRSSVAGAHVDCSTGYCIHGIVS